MAARIADYALIGNTRTAALVARDGSIDWLCLPSFSAPACFAALVGSRANGRWRIAPRGRSRSRRAYRPGSLVLETLLENDDGAVRIVDCMPPWPERTDVVRIVEGVRGRVTMEMEWIVRFGYGAVIPWVRRVDGALLATAGSDTLELRSPVETRGKGYATVAEFTVARGQRLPFVLTHFASHDARPLPIDAAAAVDATDRAWREWSEKSTYRGRWRDAVERSLITLKALTYAPTGGIVAAPTTSLPEQVGGVRNWDYRFCWVRDATFTLYALLAAGYVDEARAWREWLLRAAAGRPQDLQVLYGVAGERSLGEFELPWLPGFSGSAPVRIGNAASGQYQLDIYGEVVEALYLAQRAGLDPNADAWTFQRALLDFVASQWRKPDSGIWEVRGPRRNFTHSKVMAWVGLDRGIKAIERGRVTGPLERWRRVRDDIHATVCRRAFDHRRNTFVQRFGARDLDASLLLIPIVGFLPPDDPRVRGTIAAIERELVVGGLVARYSTRRDVDALPPGEGMFLPCSFWLADNLALVGRGDEARALLERLLALRNDVGLLAEEYDPRTRRLLGNFPQALTHVALINTASSCNAADGTPTEGTSRHRSRGMQDPLPHRNVAGNEKTALG